MPCLRQLALALLVLGLATSASAKPSWWEEVNDRSNGKADVVKKIERKPDERASDGMLGLVGRGLLCRYVARPPLAHDRLIERDDGRLLLRLKRLWSGGTQAILLDPLELIERVAALVLLTCAECT